MKVGDKVRFLDTVGGGVVKGFQGKDLVIVDYDGFDTPILIRECVVIEPTNETQVRQSVKPAIPQAQEMAKSPTPKRVVEEVKGGDLITVFLAYLPIDIKKLSTTGYECYLINDSNYFLSYTYLSRSGDGWVLRNKGVAEPNTKIFIEEFEKDQLNDLEKVCMQFVAYKEDKAFALKNTCSVEIKLDTVKFYKLHSFRENDYFDDEAILYPVMKRDLAEKQLTVFADELEQAMKEKKRDNQRPRIQPIARKENVNAPLEIDLHIDELLDTTAGLSSADILDYQLNIFRKTLADNGTQKGEKIVFIHGKGDGVLKNAIVNELKTKYKEFYFQDASFREYGFGATMVTIK